jgi:hypothetical protein
MDDNTTAVALAALLGSSIVLSLVAWHIGRAWADRIRGGPRTGTTDEVRSLRDEVTGELQRLQSAVGEMAERLDFAERLLTKEREAARLAPPEGR